MISYALASQVFASIYVMVLIGYGCAGIKLFNSSNANAIRKILNYVCIPGLIFHQIGIQPFKLETFKPLLIGLLVQLVLQTLILFISFIFPFESKKQKYVTLFYACSYSDFLFAALPITQFLFNEKYNYIPVMLSMIQYLIVTPIHNVIAFLILGPPTSADDETSENEKNNQNGEINETNLHDLDDNSIPTKRIAISGENLEVKSKVKSEIKQRLNDSTENNMNEANSTSFLETDIHDKKEDNGNSNDNTKFIDNEQNEAINNPEADNNKESNDDKDDNIDNNNDNNSDDQNLNNENTSSQNKESCIQKKCPALYNFRNKFKLKNIWTTLFFSLVTPINICFLLGIIWSAIGINMPKFLNQFVTDLEKAVVAGGLFSCGVYMWNHPYFGCNPIEVPIASLTHIVIIPLIGFLFCWIFNIDNTVTQIVLFSFAAPSALSSFAAAIYNHCTKSTITYTFFWTYLLVFPVFLLWTVLFNQTKIFCK